MGGKLSLVAEFPDRAPVVLSGIAEDDPPPRNLRPPKRYNGPVAVARMIGQTLGHYRIESKIGEGGMGVVYRAKDTKLGRDVAIKVLPEVFSQDPERLARFEREAQVLASLNHPNIAAIYGLEESGGTRYLVLEYVPGETLRGPLPAGEAVGVARQITEALEEAHEKGVMHRDLKPANIKVTPEGKVKVLDFGLAKAFAGEPASGNPAQSPTVSVLATRAGVVLGTAAYMSPEQACGKPLDRRTDIWSFGCVVYELLAGKLAFGGQTVSDSLSAILGREPDWEALPAATPQRIRDLLRRCLQKDAHRRLQHIGDARLEMEEPLAPPAERPRRPALTWALAAVAAVAVCVAVWSLRSPTPGRGPIARLAVPLGPDERLQAGAAPSLAVSPDGTRVVYVAAQKDTAQLYLRRLDRFETTPIAGTEGATGPFFSPDGEWVGFFAGDKLKKVSLGGGAPVAICDAFQSRGATWAPDGTILFTAGFGSGLGLSRVSAGGGVPRTLTTPGKGEIGHRWPHALPDGKGVLFTIWTGGGFDDGRVGFLSFQTGQWRTVAEGGTGPLYVPPTPDRGGPGFVLLTRAAELFAVPVDPETMASRGPMFRAVEGVLMSTRTGAVHYGVSRNGVLVYAPGTARASEMTLMWVDRSGAASPVTKSRRLYDGPRLSPDGRRVAMFIPESSAYNIWVHDIARDTLTRLTFEKRFDTSPVWTPDGARVTFTASGPTNIFWKRADGTGPEERLTVSANSQFPTSWSPDGKWLAFEENHPARNSDLWLLPGPGGTPGDRKPRPFLETPFTERGARFSPNGRWIAYFSNESGRYQVYVQPSPVAGGTTSGKWQISTEAGTEPVWARNGKELFYRNGDRILAVDVDTGASFSVGKPRLLFEGQYEFGPVFGNYDVAPDGRFLMVKGADTGTSATQLRLILNWLEELNAPSPTSAAGR